MALFLIGSGLAMVITAYQDTFVQLGTQLKTDIVSNSPHNFLSYMVALMIVGALGSINALRTASNMFMALIVLSLLIGQKGFFAQFAQALQAGPAPIPAAPASAGSTGGSASNWQSNGQSGDANPMNRSLAGGSSQGPLGDQSRFNNFMNSITKLFLGGYGG